jgi:hypothetical protein
LGRRALGRGLLVHREKRVHFEGRELKEYAEPVSASELREGQVYFTVNYVDEERLIPVMETVVFIGRNLEPDDVGQIYLQDVQSYREGVPYNWESEDGFAKFQTGSEDETGHIFEYEQALEELMRCSLNRKRAGSSD